VPYQSVSGVEKSLPAGQRQECGEECLEKATKVARFLDFTAFASSARNDKEKSISMTRRKILPLLTTLIFFYLTCNLILYKILSKANFNMAKGENYGGKEKSRNYG
jgi:hypothetical protein